MIAITQSETNFLGVDRGSDALRYSLPYYITFPKELSKVFSGVFTQNMDSIAPTLIPSGNGLATVAQPAFLNAKDYIAGFEYPLPNGQTTGPSATKVYPSPSWSAQFYSQLYGMAFFTQNFNQDFADQNHVFRLGTGENLAPSTGFDVVEFADPFGGGYKYAALHDMAKAPEAQPAAPAMIAKAIAQKAAWDGATNATDKANAEAALRETVRRLEIMRGLYGIFSQTW